MNQVWTIQTCETQNQNHKLLFPVKTQQVLKLLTVFNHFGHFLHQIYKQEAEDLCPTVTHQNQTLNLRLISLCLRSAV